MRFDYASNKTFAFLFFLGSNIIYPSARYIFPRSDSDISYNACWLALRASLREGDIVLSQPLLRSGSIKRTNEESRQ